MFHWLKYIYFVKESYSTNQVENDPNQFSNNLPIHFVLIWYGTKMCFLFMSPIDQKIKMWQFKFPWSFEEKYLRFCKRIQKICIILYAFICKSDIWCKWLWLWINTFKALRNLRGEYFFHETPFKTGIQTIKIKQTKTVLFHELIIAFEYIFFFFVFNAVYFKPQFLAWIQL